MELTIDTLCTNDSTDPDFDDIVWRWNHPFLMINNLSSWSGCRRSYIAHCGSDTYAWHSNHLRNIHYRNQRRNLEKMDFTIKFIKRGFHKCDISKLYNTNNSDYIDVRRIRNHNMNAWNLAYISDTF